MILSCSKRSISWDILNLDHCHAKKPWKRARGLPAKCRFHQMDLSPYRCLSSWKSLLVMWDLTQSQAFQIDLKTTDPWTMIGKSQRIRSRNGRFFQEFAFLGKPLSMLCLTKIFHGSFPTIERKIYLASKAVPCSFKSFSLKAQKALPIWHQSHFTTWNFLFPLPSI